MSQYKGLCYLPPLVRYFNHTMINLCATHGKRSGASQGVGSSINQKSAHDLTSQYKVSLYLPPFGRKSSVKLWHPIRAIRLGSQGGPRESKMVPIKIPTPHSYSTSFRTISLSGTIQQRDRQTNRVIGKPKSLSIESKSPTKIRTNGKVLEEVEVQMLGIRTNYGLVNET